MNWVTIKAHPALRFYEYKLFSRKKLMCQVKFVPIYIETPDLTEVLVGLLTCLKKKRPGLSRDRGWTAPWKKLSVAL